MGFIQKCIMLPRTLKYGSQVGKISKSGLACYAKKGKNGLTSYTSVNALTGEVVLKKDQFLQNNYRCSTVWNGKGDVVAYYEHVKTPLFGGLASDNSHACEVRNISKKYNKFGQIVDNRDVTMTPSVSSTEVNIHYSINGKNATKVLFTDDNYLSPEYNGFLKLIE